MYSMYYIIVVTCYLFAVLLLPSHNPILFVDFVKLCLATSMSIVCAVFGDLDGDRGLVVSL